MPINFMWSFPRRLQQRRYFGSEWLRYLSNTKFDHYEIALVLACDIVFLKNDIIVVGLPV
jgi:hypothetical protein